MTSTTQTAAPAFRGPLSLFGTAIFAGVAALAVLFGGQAAILGVLGAIALVVFVRYPVLGLYVSTALLLVGGSSANLYIFNLDVTASLGKLSAAVAIVAWLIHWILLGRQLVITWEVVLVTLFLAWSLLGVIYAETYEIQWNEWLRLANIVAYLIFAVHVLNTRQRIQTYAVLIAVCAMLMSAYAVFQYFTPSLQVQGDAGLAAVGAGEEKAYIDTEGVTGGGAVRVTGRTGHSNWLAFSLLIILPINVYWLSAASTPARKTIAAISILLALSALVFTFTRMGMLVGAAVLLFLVAKRLIRLTPERIAAFAIVCIIAWFALPGPYKERVFRFADNQQLKSTEARLILQDYAWRYALDAPFVGVGVSGFGLRFVHEDSWLSAHLRWLIKERNWEALYYGPHNLYLQLAAETGFTGLIILGAAMLILFVQLQRSQTALRRLGEVDLARLAGSLQVSLLAFAACAVFLHALHQKIWWMVAALAIALCYHQRRVIGQKTNHAK